MLPGYVYFCYKVFLLYLTRAFQGGISFSSRLPAAISFAFHSSSFTQSAIIRKQFSISTEL